MKQKLVILFVVVLFAVPSSVRAVDIGGIVGSAVGGIGMLAEAAKEITPSEEHYIGRAVAAMLLMKYPLLLNPSLTKYMNEVGLQLAHVSQRPVTYGGYHFAVLSTNDSNAYACPGGFIFITKGLLKELKSEDELAAILAHEVAHVADRDGINSIKKSRWTKLGFYAVGEVSKHYTPADVKELVGVFQGVVTDVAKQVIDSGYSQGDERKADANGMKFAADAGYNPDAMLAFFKEEEAKGTHNPSGPFASHPKFSTRVKNLEKDLPKLNQGGASTEDVRTARFKKMTAGL